EPAAIVMDHAEHVVNVGEPRVVALEHLAEVVLRLVELALFVVLSAQRQELLGPLVHSTRMVCGVSAASQHSARPAARRWRRARAPSRGGGLALELSQEGARMLGVAAVREALDQLLEGAARVAYFTHVQVHAPEQQQRLRL